MKNPRIAKDEMARLRDKGFEDLVCSRKKLYLVLGLKHMLLHSVKLTKLKEEETHFIDQRDSLPGMCNMVGPHQFLYY